MQIKFLSLGLLAVAVASVAADVVKVTDTDVKLHNTGSCILNNLKVENVLNDLHANVANKKRSVLSRRKINDAVRHIHHARRSENEPDEEEEDENEADENENEPDEEEEDENENEADEEEADENEVNESSSSESMRRREWEEDEEEVDEDEEEEDEWVEDEDEVDEQDASKITKRDITNDLLGGAIGSSTGGLLGSDPKAKAAGTNAAAGLVDNLI